MTDTPYSNRELDVKFEMIREKLDLVLAQTTATNGKVRKIIMAVIGLGGACAGLGFEQLQPLLALLL